MSTPNSRIARTRQPQLLTDDRPRSMPTAVPAEQALVGALMVNARVACERGADRLTPDMFSSGTTRMVYEAIREVMAEGFVPDVVTVYQRIVRTDPDEDLIMLAFCRQAAESCGSAYLANQYVEEIVAAYRGRAAFLAVDEAQALGFDDVDAVLGHLRSKLEEIDAIRPPDAVEASPFVDAGDLAENPPAPPAHVIGDEHRALLLAGELHWLSGPPRSQKSWAALDMCVSIATGTPWLSRFPVTQMRCAYLQEEGAPSSWAQRIRGLLSGRGMTPDDIRGQLVTACGLGLRLDTPDGALRVIQYLRKFEPGLLVLDPFARLHSANENDASEMGVVIRALDEIRRALGCSVVCVHHTRKARGDDDNQRAAERMRGSSAIWASGSTIVFKPHADGEAVCVEPELKDAEALPSFEFEVLHEGDSSQLVFAGLAGSKAQRDARESVKFAMTGEAPLTVSEIATKAGVSRATAHRALSALVAIGDVVNAGTRAMRGKPATQYALVGEVSDPWE